jgi:hypothetical protein
MSGVMAGVLRRSSRATITITYDETHLYFVKRS